MKFIVAIWLLALAAAAPVRAEIEPPVAIRTVVPIFPPEMLVHGIDGVVLVSCLIDTHGAVQETKVVKTSNDAFTQPALDALRKWKFKPAQNNGASVAVRVTIPLKFTIED